ncbi:ATP-grasp domain-containing protein [Aquabacterium sp.]|uniref:arsenate reductase/protein-tyrosine-phosphatase family protein n=1 Tax=Aquabacterium sp. TaxID=1872578 RepID=UPI003784A53F
MTATAPRAGSVLVLDGDQGSALAVARSLGRRGLRVLVGSDEDRPLAGLSRHVQASLRYPDPLTDAPAFVDWVAERLRDAPDTLVIPVTERTLVPLMRQRERFAESQLAIAPTAALEQVLDKDRTVRLAQTLGIPVPRSIAVRDLAEAATAGAALGFPVVVKPARSVGQDAHQRVPLTVSYARQPAELATQVQHALRFGGVILQEYFRGDGVGIEVIVDHGKVRYAFQHRRLHEVPLTGGGSSLRCSEPVVPALREAAEQLMKALGWHGVAMVEFKYDAARQAFRLIEINGRFWGSLPLALAAGADFPAMLHELLSTGRMGDWPAARDGIVCRQLARDVNWLEHVLRKAAPEGLATLPSAGQVLRDSLLVLSPRHRFDIQSWTDPWPGLVDLWRLLRHQAGRVREQLVRRWRLATARHAARPGGRAQRRLAEGGEVLFVCYGNINRSALACAAAARRGGARWRFASAGFHATAGRPADPVMVEVASAAGVDLSGWRSCTLDRTMVDQADVILVMELAHLDRLHAAFPQARGKAFLLGAPVASGPEVPDPYGQPRETYERVSRQVLAAVDRWFGGAASPQRPPAPPLA